MESPSNQPAPSSAGTPGERRRHTSAESSSFVILPRSRRIAVAKPESFVFRSSRSDRSVRTESQRASSTQSAWLSATVLSAPIASASRPAALLSQAQLPGRMRHARRKSWLKIGRSGAGSSRRMLPNLTAAERLSAVAAISGTAAASTANPCRVPVASAMVRGIPHKNASSKIDAVPLMDWAASSRSLKAKAAASSIVSPRRADSTSSISASGVHCSVQFSAQVARSCREAATVPNRTPSTRRRCRKNDRFKSRKADCSDLTRVFSRRSNSSGCAVNALYFSSFNSRRQR